MKRLICCLLLTCPLAWAANLGNLGQVYPIVEPDLLRFLQAQLQKQQASGEWARKEAAWQQTVSAQAIRPTPVSGISTTTEPRQWLFNPSLRLPVSVRDAQGREVVKAGTTVNPLDTVSLRTAWIFLNADDPDQLSWAKTQRKTASKIILVQGNVQQTAQALGQRVYFDQGGSITRRLGITHVPARVIQQGQSLQIEEIVP